jgi:glutamate 5-kinase
MKSEIWIIKIGSQIIVEEGPLFIQSIVRDIAQLKKSKNIQVIIVSSGAIATAKVRTQKNWKSLKEKQALSAIGQPLIMNLYNTALHEHGLLGAQILLTYADFKNLNNRKNFLNTLKQLLQWNMVPILNENDAIATEEIQFGDNDMLSAMVAAEIKAKKLILLTNVNGIFDRDPSDPQAQVIPVIENIQTFKIKGSQKKSQYGRGGLPSKLLASKLASKSGIESHVVKGSLANVLINLGAGHKTGTTIKASSKSNKKLKFGKATGQKLKTVKKTAMAFKRHK